MKTFKAINFKRDYEITNVKFVQCNENPNSTIWVECEASEINCEQLYKQDDKIYFGYL